MRDDKEKPKHCAQKKKFTSSKAMKNLCKMCSMEEKIANESHTMDVMKFVISR